jgi:cytochrome c
MPTTAPGSLSNSEVYSVMAYILVSADIISRDMVLDASSVPTVQMPNRDGFVADSRPEDFAAQDSR